MTFATPTSPLLVRAQAVTQRPEGFVQTAVARLFGVQGLSTAAIVTAFGIALFIDLEIIAIEAAAIWSVAGYFHLPATATLILAVLLFVPAKWLCWKVAKMALEAERDVIAE